MFQRGRLRGDTLRALRGEDILNASEVAVFGVPDDFYGEEIMAWIQPRQGESLNELEVRNFRKGRIAHFKIPRYIWFVDKFPMTVTGKLQKLRMREIAREKLRTKTY